MLEEEYKKESDGRSYLLLKKTREAFEERMIQRVMPTGVLFMAKSEYGDSYKYEITGRKNLAMTFERVPMNAEQMEKVLKGIIDILERGKEYLLAEDNFILQPEYIFLRLPEYEVTLCYYPEYKIPLAEQMGKLFEMLLNRVDYREEKAIAMVYALYMQLQEPDMTLERIREKLREQAEGLMNDADGKEKGGYPTAGMVTADSERDTGERRVSFARKEEKTVRLESGKETVRGRSTQKRVGLWERLRKEVGTKLAAYVGGAEEGNVSSAVRPVPCVREAAPEWGAQYTKVLSVKRTEAYPSIVSQKSGETVFLTKFPFYVGSLPEYTDYVIAEETVSRFHGKFIKQGGDIFLSDLNSTNGTKVNGRMLNMREQAKLANGDRVLFADTEYIFFEGEG